MIKIYMDHQVPRAITDALRVRQIDVLTAYEDGSHTLSDPELLDRATELERVLFTRDDDLLREGHQRQSDGQKFGGVIYAHQKKVSIGECINDLEFILITGTPTDVLNQVIFLPLS